MEGLFLSASKHVVYRMCCVNPCFFLNLARHLSHSYLSPPAHLWSLKSLLFENIKPHTSHLNCSSLLDDVDATLFDNIPDFDVEAPLFDGAVEAAYLDRIKAAFSSSDESEPDDDIFILLNEKYVSYTYSIGIRYVMNVL